MWVTCVSTRVLVCVEGVLTHKVDICDWHIIFIVDWSLAGAAWAGHLAGPVRLHHHQLGAGCGFVDCPGGGGSSRGRWAGGCLRCWQTGGRCCGSCVRSLGADYFLSAVENRMWDYLKAWPSDKTDTTDKDSQASSVVIREHFYYS